MTNPPSPPVFSFPGMTEDALRSARVRAFAVAASFAVAPWLITVFWHGVTKLEFFSSEYDIPDLAFAGVVTLISALTNTVFSFTKASGWTGIGRLTVAMIWAASITAVGCFLTYLKALEPGLTPADLLRLYLTAGITFVATLFFCFTMQYTFLADECKAARENILRLPQPRGRR